MKPTATPDLARLSRAALSLVLSAVTATAGAMASAAAVPALVEAALDGAPEEPEQRCSYTRIRIEDAASRRERYRAGEAEPWVLLEVDGREPTAAERSDYARGAEDRDRRHPLAFDLRSMVDPEGWQRRSETAGQAVFEFRLQPGDELDEGVVDKVRGTLVVDTTRRQPARILIENVEPAYVAPFVRIAEYRQDLTFEWDPAIGTAVLTRAETRMQGRVLGIKPLRRHKLLRYQDYQCGDGAGTATSARDS